MVLGRSILFIVFLLSVLSESSWAWGGRGHHVICSAAVHLVQNENLREFLRGRGHTMGHLCNVPDIYWKSLPESKSGDPGHYFNSEKLGIPFSAVPLDFAKLETEYAGKENQVEKSKKIFSVAEDVGSLWWRADQFFRRVVARKEAFSKVTAPQNRKEEQQDSLPYNQEIYGMMIDLGLMGHFVGDASQPLHNTADHDGYFAGHGGIHAFYEEASVAAAPGDLEAQVLAKARAMKSAPWLKSPGVLESMRLFADEAAKDLKEVFKKDPIKKSSTVRQEKGMSLKTPAERGNGDAGWKNYSPMITRQMARSARLLARFWDEAYAQAGKPDLSAYRSYRYPFTPDFVAPDYISSAKPESDPARRSQ